MYAPINGFTKESMKAKIEKEFTVKAETETGGCRYRTAINAKCGVGIFIPDDIYTDAMDEAGGVRPLLKAFPEVEQFMPLKPEALKLMQAVHDDSEPENTKADLMEWIDRNVVGE